MVIERGRNGHGLLVHHFAPEGYNEGDLQDGTARAIHQDRIDNYYVKVHKHVATGDNDNCECKIFPPKLSDNPVETR